MSTNIEWTDLTDNIIRAKEGGWWCQKSPKAAYIAIARKSIKILFGGNKLAYVGSPPELTLDTEIIRQWGFQRKPKNISSRQ